MENINYKIPGDILNILATKFEEFGALNDIKLLKDAVTLSSKVDLIKFNNEQKSRFHYFVANAWSYILNIKHNNPEGIPIDSKEYEKQIFHLRTALTFVDDFDNPNICEILTNLGCAFSHVGRYVEAQEYFNRALFINRDFGMALGNKGYGLYKYAREVYDDIHQFLFLQYARKNLLDSLSKKDIYDEAKMGFKDLAKHIESQYDIDLLNDYKQYPNSLKELSESECIYREWCVSNILFLNPLNDIIQQDVVAYDFTHTPTMILKKTEKPIFQSIYNQVKQEYVSARFLFYEGIHPSTKHYSDNGVKLYRLFDFPIYSLEVEKVKIAFRISYSIFDKIAYLLNIYLNLNIDKHRVSFRSIWHEKGNRNKPLNKEIFKKENRALQGLYWLSKDLDEGNDSPIEPNAKEIAIIRNYIEHKSFKVVECENYSYSELPETYEIEQDDFYEKTMYLLKLVRSALLYLSSAIYEEEAIKEPLNGLSMPIEMTEL